MRPTLSTPTWVAPSSLVMSQPAYPAQFVVGQGAGIHEGLCNEEQHGVHVIGRLHIKNELWVFDDVDPEPQRQAASRGEGGR